MVIVMKVVGIDLIKLFRNFNVEKSAVILTGYGDRRLHFWLTLTSKKYVPLKIAFTPNIVVYSG